MISNGYQPKGPGTGGENPPQGESGLAPERADREGDQRLPHAGKVDVLADLAASVPRDLAARRETGIRRYGRPLETWNGRDAHRDLDEELLDALAYARQARRERQDLEKVVEAARAVVKAMEGVRLPFKGDGWERLLDLRNALNVFPGSSSASGKGPSYDCPDHGRKGYPCCIRAAPRYPPEGA